MGTLSKQLACRTAMKILGDFWTLRITDFLKNDEVRFCELQRNLDNINPATLTKRLKALEEAHLVTRSEETIDKISVTYSLTELGRETLPVIKALSQFSIKANAKLPAKPS